ncbi:ATPase family AAA domain-containing protein 3-B [Lachnellula willkommii]|uniref:ATPase family AAA domain-containing protein 3-B n=1 Tax=Lachnellula willkommii TaxID=215461 RepID=A0A559M5K8_9HELO|nr:ATPase family AAA domain-containing protein 3-B [Lachnellula willkommii]
MARGDDALAGREEKDIPSHRFPPDPNNDRTIRFRGEYIEIVKEETGDQKTLKENIATDTDYDIPAGGPPGAGKTLTAEVLSDGNPTILITLQVSAGELGRTAEELEQRLPLIFERASKWNALLLLDEADVFLEQRSIGDINRNALVCVFLRTLEYYQGIMFFTTNRVKQIDPAIASRIHFKIKYDNLGLDQRRGVWDYFLGKSTTPQGPPVYSRSGLESLVEKPLNGREIKNLTSTAQALALQEGTRVTMSHLEFAIEAGEDFERDVNGAGPTEALNGYF